MKTLDFYTYKSLEFAANLLTNYPEVLLKRIDIADFMREVAVWASKECLQELTQILNLDESDQGKITKSLKELLKISSDTEKSVQRNHKKVACLVGRHLKDNLSECVFDTETEGYKRFISMSEILGLTSEERDLVALIYIRENCIGFFENALRDDVIWQAKKFNELVHHFINVNRQTARQIVESKSRLMRFGIVVNKSNYSYLLIGAKIEEYLNCSKQCEKFTDIFFEEDNSVDSAKKPCNIAEEDWHVLLKLLAAPGPANILFYGEAGTGKTTLARALCRETGKSPLNIKNYSEDSRQARIGALEVAYRFVEQDPESRVIVIDESDELLQTRYSYLRNGIESDKGWLNRELDQSKAKIIWLCNSLAWVEDSTLRRFSYSLEFKPHAPSERKAVWLDVLKENGDRDRGLEERTIDEFSRRYELQPGPISDSLKLADRLNQNDPESYVPTLERLLGSHHIRLHGKSPAVKRSDAINRRISLDGLSTDQDLKEVVRRIHQFVESTRIKPNDRIMPNMNLLLSGPPGTGKTEFVRYAARELGVSLMMKTASQLQSKFVGETEKKIAEAFEQAQKDRSILFIDEADSFLWSRDRALNSWEVTQVNEFLQQMENFEGILFCATNHMETFDHASIRRFNYKVRFNWLTDSGKRLFFERYFSDYLAAENTSQLTKPQLDRLAKVDCLAPGDFKVVYQNSGMAPEGSVTIDGLIAELEKEAAYKRLAWGKTIGFGRGFL